MESLNPMPFNLIIGETGSSWAGRSPAGTLYRTSAEARAALFEYVQRNWDSEMDGEEQPQDPEEMIAQYFEAVPERYEIVETVPA